MARISRTVAALVAASAVAFQPAIAEDGTVGPSGVELDGAATAGSLGLNITAGNANQQANVGVVAIGDTALSSGLLAQSLTAPAIGRSPSAEATVADGALAGSTGRLAINLSAGSANQQANVAAIALGSLGQVASAALLSQSRAATVQAESDENGGETDRYSVRIGEGAFEASSGLVQVNLTAGDANTSANIFSLSVPRQ